MGNGVNKENERPNEPEALEEALLLLHAAIDHAGLWKGVHALLRAVVEADRLTLFLGHLGLSEARVVFTDPPVEETAAWYAERARLNPFSAYIAENIGRPYYHFHEVVGPPEAFRKTKFYRKFARWEGWDKGLSILFWNGNEMRGMFSLYRGPEKEEFSEAERVQLLRVARHIEMAIIRVQKIHREETFRGALQAVSRTLPVPLILVDWELKPVFVNLAGYESAAVWNLGAEKAGRLNARDNFRIPAAVGKAVRGLKSVYEGGGWLESERRQPDPVLVEHPGQAALRARVNPVRVAPSTIARPGFVIVFEESFGGTAEAREAGAYRERALQRLTPAERKVVAEVCRGKRNEEIAATLKKSTLTVKTQLNAVFHKLNLRSRSELIARMNR